MHVYNECPGPDVFIVFLYMLTLNSQGQLFKQKQSYKIIDKTLPDNLIAFDEGECLQSCTIHKVVSVLYAMRFHGQDPILDWTGPAHFALISCVQFFSPGSLYLFCDTRSQMKHWQFSVYHWFVYRFSRSFQLSFVIVGKFPFQDNRICRYYVNNVFCTNSGCVVF